MTLLPALEKTYLMTDHTGQEYLFAGFAAFTIELTIREGEPVTYAEPHQSRQEGGLMTSLQGLARTFPRLTARDTNPTIPQQSIRAPRNRMR